MTGGGELEGAGLMEDILGALDGEAGVDRDDAAWNGGTSNDRVLKPEEFTLFQNEPSATPGFEIFALLVEPAGALGAGPEFNAFVIIRTRILASRRSPQALHPTGDRRPRRNRREKGRETEKCLY